MSGHRKKPTNQPTKGHSPTGDHRGRDMSGHRKKPTNQGALTLWRPQREGHVRTQKETNQPRGTHKLETTEGGTCQDTERNQPTKGHSPPGDHRGRDMSGHRKKRVRDHKIRDKEAKIHPILVVAFFE